MKKYWSKIVEDLDPYVPGEQPQDKKYIKLNTNENPHPPSPRVVDAIKKTAEESLSLYPDPNCTALRSAIADYYNTTMDTVFTGNGSDEILALSFFCFFKQENPILYPDITYSFYDAYCDFFTIDSVKVPITDDFSIDIEDYLKPNGGIIFANPNAPTGKGLNIKAIEALLKSNTDSVVVVDEAYIDFGGETVIPLVNKYPNLLVVQTFSKSRSLAGMRIGFAVGNKDLIDALERAKNSFNSYPLDRLALAGGREAILDQPYFEETVSRVIKTREWAELKLSAKGFTVIPSQANFLFISHPTIDAKSIYLKLKELGVLVRYFDKPRIDNHLRVTIGTRQEMEILLEKLDLITG